MSSKRTIGVEKVDHIGIRVADPERAMAFYRMLGFELLYDVPYDAVIIIKNANDVEINLVCNANNPNDGKNILMDVGNRVALGSGEAEGQGGQDFLLQMPVALDAAAALPGLVPPDQGQGQLIGQQLIIGQAAAGRRQGQQIRFRLRRVEAEQGAVPVAPLLLFQIGGVLPFRQCHAAGQRRTHGLADRLQGQCS